jgi:hypothetical protein
MACGHVDLVSQLTAEAHPVDAGGQIENAACPHSEMRDSQDEALSSVIWTARYRCTVCWYT